MNTVVFKSYKHFLNRPNKSVNGVSPEHARQHYNFAKDNETNKGCWNCSGCRYCTRCLQCVSCGWIDSGFMLVLRFDERLRVQGKVAV